MAASLTPRYSGSTAIAVSNVLARGAAFGAGLQVQDRIVAVDGISFRNVTHGFAVETIKNAIPNRVR
jgi:predicted metalloprotease with PDZ domain